ncbi:MAG TPA: hypothetical protein H9881_01310 [Candidatus Stackebrandtia excrementipullorum]|nr:hypothetical protein [Candidatus Stackebrandtia excrementipullorum]
MTVPFATPRRLGSLLCLVTMVLSLASCIKVDLDTTISSEDTVSGTMTAAVRHEAVEVLGAAETEEFVDTLVDTVSGVYRTEPYDDGRFIGKTVYFEHVTLEEFSRGQSEDSEATTLRIEHADERYRLDGEWRLPELDTAQAIPQLDESVLASAEFTLSVTFPGEVRRHNGRLSGKTVTWELESGRSNVMSAESLEAGNPTTALTALWILLAVVALVAVALYIQLRRHSIGRDDG